MRHTISVVVQNRFGVLTRIAGLFSGRGFNIDTLNVGPTQNDKISRMTIVVVGNDQVLEQVVSSSRNSSTSSRCTTSRTGTSSTAS